jgi:hypothetical protein
MTREMYLADKPNSFVPAKAGIPFFSTSVNWTRAFARVTMWGVLVALSLTLSACAGAELPLSKTSPDSSPLVRPPWEALVKAGPGAENDIDLETLNGPVKVADTAPPVEELQPEAPMPAKTSPKPGDTVIKAVAVLPVTGSGGAELTAAMRKVLKEAGWPVLASPRADALNIQGRVTVEAPQNGQQIVRLVWQVTTPKAANLGDVKQNNPVPAGSLDKGWGQNAGFAAEAAATGIFKLIEKFR